MSVDSEVGPQAVHGRGHAGSHGGERASSGDAIAPGKRTLTQGLHRSDPASIVVARLNVARVWLDRIAWTCLPAMRAAIAARKMEDARTAGLHLSSAFARLDGEIEATRRWAIVAGSAGALELLRPLEVERDLIRVEAEPALALVPPPAPAAPDDALNDPSNAAWEAHDAAEGANAEAWTAKVDASEGPSAEEAGHLIDASNRFGSAKGAAVQRRATSGPDLDAEQVRSAATAGVAGGGSPIPHLDTIQRSFGAHDVSGISAHVGGAAADASRTIGAEAYATGNSVGFAESPTLFVAAHEAAHVVQQRAGVQLLGGVGVAGDAYEQHADAVAECVVRGESAEALLGPRTPQGGGLSVQRKQKQNGSDDEVNERRENEGSDQSHGGGRAEVVMDSAERDKARAERRDLLAIEDQVRPLLFAQLVAEQTLTDLQGDDVVAAVERGFAGCDAITRHLQQVTVAPRLGAGRLAIVSGLVFQIAERMGKFGFGSETSVVEMLETTALVQAVFPDGAVPAIENEEQAEEAAKPKLIGVTATDLLRKSMRSIVFDLDDAVETFRSTAMQTMEEESKEPIVGGAVAAVMGQLEYVSSTVASNDVGADLTHPDLRKEVEHLRAVAQRFIYCALYEPALPDTAGELRAAMAPLLDAFGLAALVVAPGGPSSGIETNAVATNREDLKDHWRAIYKAQRAALLHLCDETDNAKSSSSGGWEQLLLTMLATATFNWTLGLVAGAFSTELESTAVGDRIQKGAIKTASSDVMKGVAKGIFDAKLSPSVTNPKGARVQFFSEQILALIDIETRHLEELGRREIQDAMESPEGRDELARQTAETKPAAAKVAEAYTTKAVQDWALYLAMHAYGEDQDTGGVNLDQVGEITGDREAPGPRGGVGALEIIVELGDAYDMPKVFKSIVKGLSDSDAGNLSKLTIGEVQIPVQIRAYGDYGDTFMDPALEQDYSDGKFKTEPASFLVSRNREGKVWLSAASDSGRAWLADFAKRSHFGDDAISGATVLFEAFSDELVGSVEGG